MLRDLSQAAGNVCLIQKAARPTVGEIRNSAWLSRWCPDLSPGSAGVSPALSLSIGCGQDARAPWEISTLLPSHSGDIVTIRIYFSSFGHSSLVRPERIAWRTRSIIAGRSAMVHPAVGTGS